MADLVSRKLKPKSAAVATKTIRLEYSPVAEEEHPGPEPVPPVAAESAAAPPGNKESAARATSHQPEEKSPAPTPTKPPEALVKRTPAPGKKVKPIAEPAAPAKQAEEVAPSVAAGPISFLDEMADLDSKVDELRRQLAKKLIEQNAQLRRMLARFDKR